MKELTPQAQMWVQDTIQTAKEQDIWRDLAIGMIDEVGAIKIILLGGLLIMLPIAATAFGIFRLLRKRGGGG